MVRPAPTRHARILAVVRRVPRGRVTTYGTVARLAGLGGQARLVGYALHALPEGSAVPWHRVLGAGGRLSLLAAGAPAGITQRLRLEREGVRIDARGRVDLARHGWPAEARRAATAAPALRGAAPPPLGRARRAVRRRDSGPIGPQGR